MRKVGLGVAAFVLLSGCKKAPPSDAPVPASAAASASIAPSASAAPSAKGTEFAILATSPERFQLTSSDRPTVIAVGPMLYRLSAKGLEQDPSLGNGLRRAAPRQLRLSPGALSFVVALGAVDPSVGDDPAATLLRFTDGKGWSTVTLDDPSNLVVPPIDWKDGHKLALAGTGHSSNNNAPQWRFAIVAGKAAVVPNVNAKDPIFVDEGVPPCLTENVAIAAVGFPSGEMFVAGEPCIGRVTTRIEHWTEGGKHEELNLLAGARGTVSLVAASPKEVWAIRSDASASSGAEPELFRYDGYSFKPTSLPEKATSVIALGFDGETPLGGAGPHLFRYVDGAWQRLAISLDPSLKDPQIDRIGVVEGIVYLSVRDGDRSFLLAPRNDGRAIPATPPHVPSWSEAQKVVGSNLATYDAPTAFCSSLVVPLQAGATPTGKFPKIAAALDGAGIDGLEFLVDDAGGTGMLTARVPNLDVGEKLVARMKEKAAPTIAKVYCRAPVSKGAVTF